MRMRAAVVLALAVLVGWSEAYPTMAGSCEGVFSGNHVRAGESGKKRGDGGWKFEVALDTSRAGTTKAASVSVVNSSPQAYYMGFLLKSFDLETGKYIGKFSNLPEGTELYAGCPVAEAAVHHNRPNYFDSEASVLKVNVEWPANRELGFALYAVESNYEWYEVYGSTTGLQPDDGLDNLMLYQDIFSPRLGKTVWALLCLGFYVPMILLVFVGAMAKGSNGPGQIGATLNHSVPVKNVPEMMQLSLGEWLSHGVFYLVQTILLALMTVQIISETKDLPFEKHDGIKWFPNPWDAAFARATGRLLQANLALTLLLPTRNAVWPAIVGISFERCVKYHRIIGRWTFINLVVHWVAMIMVYGGDTLTVRSGRWGEGNLYGTLAGVSMGLLVLSAAEPIRRRYYELFLALHMMAFPMLIFSVLHVRDTLVHLILPLALYSIDWLMRIIQWSREVKTLSAQALPDGCTRLHLRCPAVAEAIWNKKADGLASFVYIQISAISNNPMEWHPFTVSGLEWTGSDTEMTAIGTNVAPHRTPDSITVHIKTMGAGTWSDRLLTAVSEKRPMNIRLEGPYGHMGVDLRKYSHILSISGGVGFTPCAPLLQMVLNPERRKACLPLLKSVTVVWVVRSPATLSWFEPLLTKALSLHASHDFRLQIELYVTRNDISVPVGPGAHFSTRSGRPQLDAICEKMATESNGEAVATLVCGPAALTSDSVKHAREAGFHTHTETFLL